MSRFAAIALSLFTLGATAAYAQGITPEPEFVDPSARKPRTGAVSLEVGANSLSSLAGIKGTVFLSPQVAMDVGLGLSLAGFRTGVYGRYLFSTAKLTPFVYGGLKYAMGLPGLEMEDVETGAPYKMNIEPSAFGDVGFGIDYLANFGLYITAGFGWSQLLGSSNVEYVSGATPTQEDQDINDLIAGSGIGFFLSLGYAF